jgi:hypothetical protein
LSCAIVVIAEAAERSPCLSVVRCGSAPSAIAKQRQETPTLAESYSAARDLWSIRQRLVIFEFESSLRHARR